jgi:HTH-type transcriptional regulator, sugar sensing transcriptional regulator
MRMPPENPVRLVECLKSLGMTKYEALVYIALLRVHSATATEIHESSGVPRASVYPVLDQLLDKDLVSVSQSAPKRFAAFPPDETITRLLSYIERDAQTARDALLAIYHKRISPDQGSGELIWNLYGIVAIRKRLVELISGASSEIQMIAHPDILSAEVRTALADVGDGVTVRIITSFWDGPHPENLKIRVRKHPDIPEEPGMATDLMAGGICILDEKKVLVIVGSGDADMVALFSESEGFVRFFVRYYTLIAEWARKKTGGPVRNF